MRTESAARSDVGRRREHNEDAMLADDGLGLYVVADGVGGQAKGEIASEEAVSQVAGWVRSHLAEIDAAVDAGDDLALGRIRRLLESAVQAACYMVFGLAEQDPEKKGMSTTMSLLLLRRTHGFVAQVGDSRVYQLREHQVLQITEDHTLINHKIKQGLLTPQEALTASGRNVITRAVGHKDYVQVDTFDFALAPGDRYLLCSDGLHGYLQTAEQLVKLLDGGSLVACAENCIAHANKHGGKDNVTAIVVAVS
jgi:serine/threonine protein phosphatase PrpC